jgi:hypothetical protein
VNIAGVQRSRPLADFYDNVDDNDHISSKTKSSHPMENLSFADEVTEQLHRLSLASSQEYLPRYSALHRSYSCPDDQMYTTATAAAAAAVIDNPEPKSKLQY